MTARCHPSDGTRQRSANHRQTDNRNDNPAAEGNDRNRHSSGTDGGNPPRTNAEPCTQPSNDSTQPSTKHSRAQNQTTATNHDDNGNDHRNRHR